MGGPREVSARGWGQTLPLAISYLRAKSYVLSAGYGWESALHERVRIDEVTESQFLREAAWVIMSAGLNERVVRHRFEAVSAAFDHFPSAHHIASRAEECSAQARVAFNHEAKIGAIVQICQRVEQVGFGQVREWLINDPIPWLRQFPYLGPATACHLAKNLGVDVAKPDRHLCRIAAATGFTSAESLCNELAGFVGETVRGVDLVIWRFATLRPDYLEHFGGQVWGTSLVSG